MKLMALFNASSNLWDNVASLEELKNFTCILKVLSFSAMSFLKKKKEKKETEKEKKLSITKVWGYYYLTI